MKAFTVLLILFFLIILIATTGVAQVDLTPDTPPAQASSSGSFTDGNSGLDDNVIVIQDSTQPQAVPVNPVPVTGTCTDPYTVRDGDTVSGIAALCSTDVGAIRQANPGISNINMIYAGQQIRIPLNGSVQPVAQAQPTPLPLPVKDEPDVTVPLPVTGPQPMIQPATVLEVKAINFPPITEVNIAIGPQNSGYNIVATGITDAAGSLTTNLLTPTNSNSSQEPWVVVVATVGDQPVQAMSESFYIASTQ